ncbi:hypothetical protein GCM10010082_17490 [Kushneria pakistanensis]|uniref:Uncharacterized protein n=1 Tax=Kushneria pakistanensis TaxID=1508770 RepID=A0ABQ3FI00_9GAMM|nr:hypothetical protein [Kushneria pakistanensis]GHC25162.1 hypothetical protein GCM10010082_17490 [Kushneria pakistanensis]
MIRLLKLISVLMLVLAALLPLLYLFDVLGEVTMKWWMLAVTLGWFAVTPCWMGREEAPVASEGGHD